MISIKRRTSFPNTIKSLNFAIVLANCFGLLPVEHERFRCKDFTWKSWKMCYAMSVLLLSTFVVATGCLHLFFAPTFAEVVQWTFFFNWAVTVQVFLNLATKWPKIMNEWYKVDVAIQKNYEYPHKLDHQLKALTLIIMILATVEYLLSLISRMEDCIDELGYLDANMYYSRNYPNVFGILSYRFWLACLVQISSVMATFTWNFIDVFIILLSSILAKRFKQISMQLSNSENTAVVFQKTFWIEIREDYDRLANLCKNLDSSLSFVVLIAFTSNLFFVLVQLFNTLRIHKSFIDKLYFFYSFSFLIFRTIAVLLYTAWINDESKTPSVILQSVPSNVYNEEIQRFLQQLRLDSVALTGNKMFKITRGLILGIAGAIVTYELVFLQVSKLRETLT